MNSIAFYVTHSWEITPKLILSDGIRYSNVNLNAKFNDKSFFPFPFQDVHQQSGAVNGNLGLSYLPGSNWKIAFLASSGFRAPNVDDLGKVFESVAGSLIVPNPNLKPEYTYNTDFNVSKVIADQIIIEAGGYYTWYRNAIAVQNSTFNGQSMIIYDGQPSNVTTNVNANKAFIYGFFGQVKIKLAPTLYFNSALNSTFGRIKADPVNKPLDHVPPIFGKSSLRFQVKKFNSELSLQYNGWKKLKDYNIAGEDNLQYATADGMPSWCILNLRTAYQLSQKLQIQAAVENIFDQNYRVFASGISSAGRNLVLSVRGNF
jgi:hemoglobin/transferrin/lactoferrin receptor protein